MATLSSCTGLVLAMPDSASDTHVPTLSLSLPSPRLGCARHKCCGQVICGLLLSVTTRRGNLCDVFFLFLFLFFFLVGGRLWFT